MKEPSKILFMEPQIKAVAEAITHKKTRSLVESHVKELAFNEGTRHLVVFMDNAGPLHELSDKENDHHLQKALEDVYGDDITYELKVHKGIKPLDRGERFFGKIK